MSYLWTRGDSLKNNERKNSKRQLLLFTCLSLGVLAGAYFGQGKALDSSLQGDWYKTFISIFSSSALFVTVSFLLGFCAVFAPLQYVVVIFKGLGLGAVAKNAYSSGRLLPQILLFLLFSVFSCLVLVSQAGEAVGMSQRYLAISVTTENRLGLAVEFKEYIFKYLIYLILCGIIGALNSLSLSLLQMWV